MKVIIRRRETNDVVATYPIVIGGINYRPSLEEAFDIAWRSAVDDGLVSEKDRDAFEFQAADT